MKWYHFQTFIEYLGNYTLLKIVSKSVYDKIVAGSKNSMIWQLWENIYFFTKHEYHLVSSLF